MQIRVKLVGNGVWLLACLFVVCFAASPFVVGLLLLMYDIGAMIVMT